jgi:hypothetical protein
MSAASSPTAASATSAAFAAKANGVDHRSATMRRLKDLVNDHVSDLGGIDPLSSAQRALVRRASMICLQLELMEAKWNENETGEASAQSLDVYVRAAGHLRRLLDPP